jgi:hypothetical protein
MRTEQVKPKAEWETGAWIALSLLALAPQTDQVLRQRCALLTELALLGRKDTQ